MLSKLIKINPIVWGYQWELGTNQKNPQKTKNGLAGD